METLNGPWPTALLALGSPWEALGFVGSILMVALGLGFVIFLHELGHFVMAKRAGVMVEKFSIGFGPALLKFRKGETEYALSAIPLGGYVKMLGEEPGEDEARTTDPRAYQNKPVRARMGIISAGVIMNLFLGIACFIASYLLGGLPDIPPLVGAVIPGTPAYEAGIRPGDKIVAVDGRKDPSFKTFQMRVALSGNDDVVHLDMKRPGVADEFRVDVKPKRMESRSMPMVGLGPATSLELAEVPYKAPRGAEGAKPEGAGPLEGGDVVVKMGPAGGELQDLGELSLMNPDPILALDRLESELRSRPMTVEVRRAGKAKSGAGKDDAAKTATATLPPNHFLDLGLILGFGPIEGIQHGSPAEAAGFQKGDTIVKVEGLDPLDPMRLPDFCRDHAGEEIAVEVARTEAGLTRTHTLKVKPDATPPWTSANYPEALMSVPGLGLAYGFSNRVVGAREGSPAEGKVQAGDVLDAIILPLPEPPPPRGWIDRLLGRGPKREDLMSKGETFPWPSAFLGFQHMPGTYTLTFAGKKAAVDLEPAPVEGWYNPDRGLRFVGLMNVLPPQGIKASTIRGGEDAVESIYSTYATVRSLIQGRVGRENIAGPIRIFGAGRHIASAGLAPFLNFLGLLSVNLAVINFLPIPPLDGGQMAFLVAEGVRGRPLPESALAAGTYIGLSLVLCLMVFVFGQDIYLSFAG